MVSLDRIRLIGYIRSNMKFHFHNDPNWQLDGAWYLHQCKCGARKITRAFNNMVSPRPYGWPSNIDSHGVPYRSSGWVKEPTDGWPRPEDAPVIRPPKVRKYTK